VIRLIREPEDVSNRSGALFVFLPEEWIMTQIANTQTATPAATPPAAAAKAQAAAPTIAVRKSCNPDGIGLSHYVLMDRKAAK
jgi:modified peptide precursor CbpA